MKPAAPRPVPQAVKSSYVIGRSKRDGSTTGLATPENTAFHVRPDSGPPAGPRRRAERRVPISTSATTGLATSPTTVATTVPGDDGVPSVRNHWGPRARIHGTLERVSALLTSVGLLSWGPRCPAWAPAGIQPICGAVENR